MKPHQIISLMTFDGADNTLALPDHDDHIHVGFRPLYGATRKRAKQLNSVLKPGQWIKLIDRLGEIDNPTVSTTPSKYALEGQPPATRQRRPPRATDGKPGRSASSSSSSRGARPGRRPLRAARATPARIRATSSS